MFCPRFEEKSLQIPLGSCGIVENSPPERSVTATDALILINYGQKLGCRFRIDDVFDGHQDRSLIRFWLRKQSGFSPMIPTAQVNALGRKGQRKPQKNTSCDSKTRDQQGNMNIRTVRRVSPEETAKSHASLKNEQVHCEDPCSDPIGSEVLN
jgi:hypothetical protein